MNFDDYLTEQRLKPNTVQQHVIYIAQFQTYIDTHSLAIQQLTYTEILDYVEHLKSQDKSISLINRILLALRYYFSYLQSLRQITHNPAAGLSLKGTVRSVPHNLLSKTELTQLYESYTITDDRTHRNKVLLGLLIHQALTREELEKLRPEHLKLREGKLQVPQTGKQNGRILALEPHQILDLQEYLLIIRPKLQTSSERLFTGRSNIEDLKNTLLHLNHALRKLNPKLKNATHIRQSVITELLKEKDLRTVQYMAGHRYVSSTERYQTDNLEDLKEALGKFHPLKQQNPSF